MESPDAYRSEDVAIIGDVLDVVKTARYQFGTIAHMGEDLEHSVAGMHAWLQRPLAFFSDPRNITYMAAAIITAAAMLNYLRARQSARAQLSPNAARLLTLVASALRR